jgi:hypothetical protein
MSVYKRLNRINVILPSGDKIPTILSTVPESRLVPKTNGEPGNWKNDYADGVQLAPDGETVYPQSDINLAFVEPRDEVIDALDVNPETGEVVSTAVEIPGELNFLFQKTRNTVAQRVGNGGSQRVTRANPVSELTE